MQTGEERLDNLVRQVWYGILSYAECRDRCTAEEWERVGPRVAEYRD